LKIPVVSRFGNALAAAACVLAFAGTHATAQTTIYDNGPFDPADDSFWAITNRISADDFTFASPTSFNAIRCWAVDGDPVGLLPSFSGTLTWTIWTDDSVNDIPDTILLSGTTSDVTLTDTGQTWTINPEDEIVQMDFTIPEVILGPGTYWLSFKENGPRVPGDGSNIFLVATPETMITGAGAQQDNDETNPSDWSTPDNKDIAYQLLVVVPEPGTFALLGLGVLPIVGMIAKRRRQA
jgi:hypothetical protein